MTMRSPRRALRRNRDPLDCIGIDLCPDFVMPALFEFEQFAQASAEGIVVLTTVSRSSTSWIADNWPYSLVE